jgi:hypothetical protein
MKYIKLVNFVEISSAAFLAVIDDVYDKTIYVQGKIVIDMSHPRVKKVFDYSIDQEIQKHLVGFGDVQIFINTCRPFDNWRKEERGSAIKACKYTPADDSVLVNKKKLEAMLDRYWARYKKKYSHKIFLENKELDSIDLESIVKSTVGQSFVSGLPNRFLAIKDSNYQYARGLQEQIPDYLTLQIETTLRQKGLI